LILSILLLFDKCACHNRWLYQFTPHDARKLIDRTLQTLYLQTQASRTWIILYQIHYSLLQMVLEDLKLLHYSRSLALRVDSRWNITDFGAKCEKCDNIGKWRSQKTDIVSQKPMT